MLEAYVGSFTAQGAKNWNGIPASCNVATVYWILDALGKAPTTAPQLATYNIDDIVRRIALAGTRIFPANLQAGHAHVQPGSVMVFMTTDLTRPQHSCVVTGGLTVGGYNQAGWFSHGGLDHQYSTHDLATELMWVDRMLFLPMRRVQNLNNHEYYLYATSDVIAMQYP